MNIDMNINVSVVNNESLLRSVFVLLCLVIKMCARGNQ